MGRVLELLHGQRDKCLTVLALHVGWLLKGWPIRAANKVSHSENGGVLRPPASKEHAHFLVLSGYFSIR
jgi:hypothetical protein